MSTIQFKKERYPELEIINHSSFVSILAPLLFFVIGFLLPFLPLTFALRYDADIPIITFLLAFLIAWRVAFYFLKVVLWKKSGTERIIFKDTEIEYWTDYWLFKSKSIIQKKGLKVFYKLSPTNSQSDSFILAFSNNEETLESVNDLTFQDITLVLQQIQECCGDKSFSVHHPQ